MIEENKNSNYTWTPSLKWLVNSFVVILAVSAVMFFVLNFLLKDYIREIPKDVTPWLVTTQTQENK